MGKIYYFAYASNLDVATLDSRVGATVSKVGLGLLPQYGFRFNFRNPDGSARANIVPSPNESVYGVVFEISESAKDHFLTSEPGYEFIKKEINTAKGAIEAFVFVSEHIQEGIFPAKSYWETIYKGGLECGIPATYLSQIMNRAGITQSLL